MVVISVVVAKFKWLPEISQKRTRLEVFFFSCLVLIDKSSFGLPLIAYFPPIIFFTIFDRILGFFFVVDKEDADNLS